MKRIINVTLTNNGGHHTHDGHEYYHGVPCSYYPNATPGAMYRVTIEYIGSDPKMKPSHFAFIPRSEFGGPIHSERLVPEIAECRRAIRRGSKNEPVPGWWKSRLKKLLADQRNYRQSIKTHRAAVREWRKNLKRHR